jgi:hypothetical protein
MAEKRIVEIELLVERTNTPFVDSQVASYNVDRTGLRIDDTVGPLMNIIFKKCPQIEDGSNPGWNEKKITWLSVRDQIGSQGRTETVFERTLMEYSLKQYPIFQRYRLPFYSFESELHDKPDSEYVGNPNRMLTVGNSVNVYILSPFQIDPKKTKIVLQFVELRGHIGPAAIKVK